MTIDIAGAANLLRERDRFVILIHVYPDGDTIGGGFALCRALRAMGKQATVRCSTPIPPLYNFLTNVDEQSFEPQTVVTVDVADLTLLGEDATQFENKIDLCIDHHATNRLIGRYNLIDSMAAAACEIVYNLILELGVTMDQDIATCLYTGISTDTGCFKFANTTPETHQIAAETMKKGVPFGEINRLLFDTKSRPRIELERLALDGMEFHFDGRCALISITRAMREQTGADEGDLEGMTVLSRQVEGVLVGVTIREKLAGGYKISVRSHEPIDAAALCAKLGGGGHPRAAGCSIDSGTLAQAKQRLLSLCEQALTSSAML